MESGKTLKVLAYSQDDTIKLDEGKLDLINNEILQTTGAIQIKAESPTRRIICGRANSSTPACCWRPAQRLTVPAGAVQQGQNGMYVYAIRPDDTVEKRNVTVAQISGGQALIDSGLAANERIVVDGQYKLQPGSHVAILHGKAAQEAAAQNAEQIAIP